MGKNITKTYFLLDAIATEIFQLFKDQLSNTIANVNVDILQGVFKKIDKLNIGKFAAEIQDQASQYSDSSEFLIKQKRILYEKTMLLNASVVAFIDFLENFEFHTATDGIEPEAIIEEFGSKIETALEFIRISGENINELERKNSLKKIRGNKKFPIRPTLEDMLGKEKLDEVVEKLVRHNFAKINEEGLIIWEGYKFDKRSKKSQLVALSYVLEKYYNKAYKDADRHYAFTTFFNINLSTTMFKYSKEGDVNKHFELFSFLK